MKPEITEIAQWVIDNRYPKSENNKVTDSEMYQMLIDKLSELRKPSESETGRTDEELVQKIETLIADSIIETKDDCEYSIDLTKCATEITKLLPSSICQENDVNVELLEALKMIRDDINSGESATTWFLDHIQILANSAIINYEKQTNQINKNR